MSLRGVKNNFQFMFRFHVLMTEPLHSVVTLSDKCVPVGLADIPVKEEQYRQHGLVYVAVADPLIEEEAGVPHHRFQGVLPHDVVELVCVQVLVHQLVAELAEMTDTGAGGACRQAPSGTEALGRTGGHGVITSVGQVQAATATVQANGRAAVIV